MSDNDDNRGLIVMVLVVVATAAAVCFGVAAVLAGK